MTRKEAEREIAQIEALEERARQRMRLLSQTRISATELLRLLEIEAASAAELSARRKRWESAVQTIED